MSLTNTNDLNTFLFFGCWNNINCKEDNFLYRDIVLYSIKELEKPVDTLYIAGDNWYNFITNNNEVLNKIISNDESDLAAMNAKDLTNYVTPILISGYYSLYNMIFQLIELIHYLFANTFVLKMINNPIDFLAMELSLDLKYNYNQLFFLILIQLNLLIYLHHHLYYNLPQLYHLIHI